MKKAYSVTELLNTYKPELVEGGFTHYTGFDKLSLTPLFISDSNSNSLLQLFCFISLENP